MQPLPTELSIYTSFSPSPNAIQSFIVMPSLSTTNYKAEALLTFSGTISRQYAADGATRIKLSNLCDSLIVLIHVLIAAYIFLLFSWS